MAKPWDKPAFAQAAGAETCSGLTRREWMATEILQALVPKLSNNPSGEEMEVAVVQALAITDVLIVELGK